MHGRSLTPKTWLDKAMSAVQSAAAEAHQQQTSDRTHEAHLRLVSLGRVVGGRVFGYRNEHKYNGVDASGNPVKSHTERVISDYGRLLDRVPTKMASPTGLNQMDRVGGRLRRAA